MLKRKLNKMFSSPLNAIVHSIIIYETLTINENSLVNQDGDYFVSIEDLQKDYNRRIEDSIHVYYEKLSSYPITEKHQINFIFNQIEQFCINIYIDLFQKIFNMENEDIEARMYADVYYQEAYAQILIFNEILKDKVDLRRHKNRPIILAGVWGILGSLLGAVVGAVATLIASGIIK